MPTAWLAEGLLAYLTAEEATRLLAAVGAMSPPGGRLAVEYGGGGALLARAGALPALAEYAALWHGGLGDATADWLAGHGWHVRTHDGATFAAALGRPEPDDGFPGAFLTAERSRVLESAISDLEPT
jgi:O-methyltransferase involved in polyketide biosynthesis